MKIAKPASLRFRLIIMLSFIALIVWAISTAVAWLQVRKEVNEVFDAQQILFAKRLASSDLRTILIERHRPEFFNGYKNRRRFMPKKGYDGNALAFAVFTPNGEIVLSDGENGDGFIFAPARGFSVTNIRDSEDKWRIFWLPLGDRLIVAVGQELGYRENLIQNMVFGQMWIWFASLPFLLGLIVWVISRELRALRRVGEQLSQRAPADNTALSVQHVPREILPLVNELNRFFDRTASMLLRERRFTSDAAHELRSPLAALRIQTEVAQLAGDDNAVREQALKHLTQGIDRATQLVEQLLTLSRLDNLQQLDNLETIHWDKLIPSLIGELYFSARKSGIELAFEQQALPPQRQGQPLLLSLMLRNLIDNAIRYCRAGSTVTVRLTHDRIVVEDNGGGVEEADLTKLGQRFYRPAGQNEKGSGLGLSIVYRIAQLHHYQVRLKNGLNAKQEKGLQVSILFN